MLACSSTPGIHWMKWTKTGTLCQDNLSGQGSNPERSKYKSRALALEDPVRYVRKLQDNIN
jgi:hypothetical protein